MKTTVNLVLLGFTLLSSMLSHSQFLIRGGLTISNTPLKDATTNQIIPGRTSGAGFHIGGAYDIYLSDIISLEPGIQFSLRPFKTTEDNQIYKINTFYVEVPFAMKTYFLETGSVRFFGLSGMYLGINVSTRVNGQVLTIGNTAQDFFKPLDFGMVLGTGIEIDESFMIHISYEPGLSNITPAPLTAQQGIKEKNRALRLTLGYKFN